MRETMELVTFIGKWPILAAIALACTVWLLWRKYRAEALVFGAALLSFGLNPLLKELVVVWHSHSNMSFPSGHAYTSVVIFGLLYYLAPILFPWRRAVPLVRVSSLSLIALIGLSRVYLGAHWPSDVLGGILVGGIVLALLIHLHRRLSPEGDAARSS